MATVTREGQAKRDGRRYDTLLNETDTGATEQSQALTILRSPWD